MRLYAERVPEEFHPAIYGTIREKFNGDYEAYAEWLFSNTRFISLEGLMTLLEGATWSCSPKTRPWSLLSLFRT